MKAKVIVLIAFLLVSVSLFAQENKTEEEIRYSNITEFGFMTASFQSLALEATTVHGFSMNKKHHFGLGTGIGGNFGIAAYLPVFANYRLYFKPDNTPSPFVNVAVGGLVTQDEGGVYSALTMGFRSGKFSLSSGISVMLIDGELPFGVTIKCGFTF